MNTWIAAACWHLYACLSVAHLQSKLWRCADCWRHESDVALPGSLLRIPCTLHTVPLGKQPCSGKAAPHASPLSHTCAPWQTYLLSSSALQ